MSKLACVALAIAACADPSSSMNPGSDAGADADPAARAWTFSSFANGQRPQYAVSPSGTVAVVTNDDVGVLRIYLSDGTSLGSPNGPQANHEGVYGIGFDAAASLHLLFRIWGHTTIDHWVYRAQAWHALPSLGVSQLEIENGPRGELYALAKTISGSLAELSFLTFETDETITTEPLWTIGATDPIAFAVGRDGNPALAWGKADADAYPQYAHRGSTGWRQTQLGTERMRLPKFAIAAAELATVFINTTDDRYLSQQSFTTWTEPVRTEPHLSATTDAFGIIHTCAGDHHGQLVQGTLTVTPLNDGGWDCWLATDAAGRVHLGFHIGNVIKRAVYE